MATQLTITVDDALAERARQFAERRSTSISAIVGDMLEMLTQGEVVEDYMEGLGPIARQFVGIARGAESLDGAEEDYRRYLLEKYSR